MVRTILSFTRMIVDLMIVIFLTGFLAAVSGSAAYLVLHFAKY
jgi:hypothetical protein